MHVRAFVCACVHAYKARACMQICGYVYVRARTCMYAYVLVRMCACACVLRVCVCTCGYAYVCTLVCACACTRICVRRAFMDVRPAL